VRARYPTKPVVVMTGQGQEMSESIQTACRIGAYPCLYKPFEMDELFRLIDEIRIRKLQNVLAAA
jgi:DNA-binding NtrC family response regulator